MKNLKSMIKIVLILVSVSGYSQLEDPLLIQNEAIYNKKFNDKLGLKKLDFPKNKQTLHLFNKNTNLYDNYLNTGSNTYLYSNSNTHFANNSLMHDNSFIQQNPLLRKNYFQGNTRNKQITDSFNPRGASTFNEALFGRFLGSLLD